MGVSSADVQRLFLQAILSRRILSQKLAAKIWEKCIDAVKEANETVDIEYRADRNSWDNFVTSVNEALNPLDLEFAHLHDEVSGKEMYAVVNRKGDEIAQLATEYTATEIAYFKAVLEQIMLAPNESFCVSAMACLREVNSLKTNMTKSQAETTLSSFVARGWLLKSKLGRYSLSTRTVLELQIYLRNTYEGELLDCTICMELVTRGIACYTNQCKTRMHTHCFNNFKRRHHQCPSCSQSWTEANLAKLRPVGEPAYREGQDLNQRRARRKSTGDDDEDEEDEEERDYENGDDAEPEPSQSQPAATQQKSKGKRKAAREASEEAEEQEESPPPQTQTQRRRSSRR
ncbi:Non-structural maintenance of chromosomes element 1 -like protein [Trametes pubescens]|uniref:Non-structural maintenance of chromosomes element 1 homolog n=1 Tax=Trametes pubescens TaxID=154538 RepID=A0A1M2V6C6_TRAPU|nr:Non-structural maintenance of chromosomes element 1 -like protein [Trametes pubescens]